MISLAETRDVDLAKSLFTSPDVWPFIHDDFTANPDDLVLPSNDFACYLLIQEDGKNIGCFMLQEINGVLLELHTVFLKGTAGNNATEAFNKLMAFIEYEYPQACRLRTWVPSFNRPAIVGALRVGFKRCGIDEKAVKKNGVLHDLHLFGVSLYGRC